MAESQRSKEPSKDQVFAQMLNRIMFSVLYVLMVGFLLWGLYRGVAALAAAHDGNIKDHLAGVAAQASMLFFLSVVEVKRWLSKRPSRTACASG